MNIIDFVCGIDSEKHDRLSFEDINLINDIVTRNDKDFNKLSKDERRKYFISMFKDFDKSIEGKMLLRFMYDLGGFGYTTRKILNEREIGFEMGVRYVGSLFFNSYLDAIKEDNQ